MVDASPEEPNYAKQSRTALRGLFFIAVIAAMYVARDFLLPVVLASFIALTFRPAVRYLSRHYIPPWLSATLLAILLVGGNKGGADQRRFYKRLIAVADARFDGHLDTLKTPHKEQQHGKKT